LIGAGDHDNWYVLESIDPGPSAIFQPSYFEYDHRYVNHLANKVRLRYASPLRLMGLWHRHPGSLDRFSGTDDSTHVRYLDPCGGMLISGLANVDPSFRLTFYLVSGNPPTHQKLDYVVGAEHFPNGLLAELSVSDLLKRVNDYEHRTSPRIPALQEIRIGTPGIAWGQSGPVDEVILGRNSETSYFYSLMRPIRKFFGREESSQSSCVDWSRRATAPISGKEDGSAKEEVLEMLDIELEYLGNQQDFEYELEMGPSGIVLNMRPLAAVEAYSSRLELLFTLEKDHRVVKHGSQTYTFRKGIVKELAAKKFS
jgi:hypothetical protein